MNRFNFKKAITIKKNTAIIKIKYPISFFFLKIFVFNVNVTALFYTVEVAWLNKKVNISRKKILKLYDYFKAIIQETGD